MPELPEVETTRLGLQPHAEGQRIHQLVVRNPNLRWPVNDAVQTRPCGQTIRQLRRRGKYLILDCDHGSLIVHLGMSGSLRVVDAQTPASPHEHLDIVFDNGAALRLRDPRRFGAVLWSEGDPLQHPLLTRLGIEPLSNDFDGARLYRVSRSRTAIKTVLMDSQRIAGIGNIYANEALFQAGIHPLQAAQSVSRKQADRLAQAIRETLTRALAAGGSSLRDFVGGNGQPGYFQQHYAVYGRDGAACPRCGQPIQQFKQNQRSSFFCPNCQKNQRQAKKYPV